MVDHDYVMDSSINPWSPEDVVTPVCPFNWRIIVKSETLGTGSNHDVLYGSSDSMKRACWCRLKRKSDGKNGWWVYMYAGGQSAGFTKTECYNQCPGICAKGTYNPTEYYETKNLLLFSFLNEVNYTDYKCNRWDTN
jgi:hypothetical protein